MNPPSPTLSLKLLTGPKYQTRDRSGWLTLTPVTIYMGTSGRNKLSSKLIDNVGLKKKCTEQVTFFDSTHF